MTECIKNNDSNGLESIVDTDFNVISNESSDVNYVNISKTKTGSNIIINDHPCKIVDKVVVKNGKHGHSKTMISATDIFTGRLYQATFPSGHRVPVPVISRSTWSIMNIEDDNLSLYNSSGLTDYSLKLLEGKLGENILQAFNKVLAEDSDKEILVVVLSAGDKQKIIEMKHGE